MDSFDDKTAVFQKIRARAIELIAGSGPNAEKLLAVCDMLNSLIPYYDWVGFYFVDREKPDELVLGPFVGAPTEHVRIRFGKGICGQAAEKEETIVIQDVSQENNYLACSIDVRSEIVVPIFKDGTVMGELDIDSHDLAPFDREDRELLEAIAEQVGKHL